MPIVIAAMPLAASTSNLPGSETTVFSPSSYASTLYGFITLADKQSISMLESESVAAVATLNMRRLAETVPQVTSVAFGFRQCSYLITKSATLTLYCGAVCVTIIVETFCIGGQI